jgi:arginase
MAEFVCIGVPYFVGETIDRRTEVAQIRASGFAAGIEAPWIDVDPDFGYGIDPVVAVNRALAAAIEANMGRIPIIFAADCVSALGVMKGLAAQKPAVIWLDAHGDFNTPQTTPSGFLGGMPLAMLVGRGAMHLMNGIELAPVPETDVILTDARDLDPMESIALRDSRVTHLLDVRDLLTVPLPDRPLYIHLDTDIVDPAELPGMAYPAPDGPDLATVAGALRRVARDGRPAGLLVSLWSAALTDDPRALNGTLGLARAFTEALNG